MPTNETRQIFIQNTGDTTPSGASTPADVASGKITMFDLSGSELTFGHATAVDDVPEAFTLVQGGPDYPLVSNLIEKERLVRVTKTAYRAPVTHRVTLTSIPTGTEGEAILKIIDNTDGLQPEKRVTAVVPVETGDTEAEIAQALVDAVNAIPQRTVDASLVNTNDVQLDARDVLQTFTIALDGVIADATETVRPLDAGSGSGEEIAQAEEYADSLYSRYYVDSGILGRRDSFPRFAEEAGQYDVYIVEQETNTPRNMGLTAHATVKYIIALESSVTRAAVDLDEFFADFLVVK